MSKEVGFSGTQAGQAFVVVATENLDKSKVHDLKFKRVDLQSRTFLKEYKFLRFTTVIESLFGADELRKPATMAPTEFRFGGTSIPAGDYALVSHAETSSTGYSTFTWVNCYASGAPIFRFREGAVHIVHVPKFSWLPGLSPGAPPAVDYVKLQAQVGEILAGYPNITAQRVVAEPVGNVKFGTPGKNDCTPANPATFTRAPATNW